VAFAAAEQHPHLAVCPACREQFERLAVMDRELSNQWRGIGAAWQRLSWGDGLA